MAYLGNILIPDENSTGTAFPLKPDYPYSVAVEPGVFVHTFGSADAKIEQRFTAGDGQKRYSFRLAALTKAQRASFTTFWYLLGGGLTRFPFHRPNSDGTTTTVNCRFADSTLTLDAALGSITSTGLTLVEVPGSAPTYTSSATVNRGPVDGSLAAALLAQVQTLIPVVAIQPVAWETKIWGPDVPAVSTAVTAGDTSIVVKGLGAGVIKSGSRFILNDATYTTVADATVSGGHTATLDIHPATITANAIVNTPVIPLYPMIRVSDRLVTIDGNIYQPRLLDWDGISQSISGSADQASFTFGNADRVITALANSIDLRKSDVRFSLFHVNTLTMINLWRGHIVKYRVTAGPEFPINCLDGIYELTLPFPIRQITRTCGKPFNRAEAGCPYASAGSGGDANSCDKGFDTANGCRQHGMDAYFGGLVASPQSVDILDNTTGIAGFGRDHINSTSQVSDSVYDQVVPEIYSNWAIQDGSPSPNVYANDPNDAEKGFPVQAKIIEGRKEDSFYAALGIVGEGPLGFPSVRKSTVAGSNDGCNYFLDNQAPHGISSNKSSDIIQYGSGPWGARGLRRGGGHDPAVNNDPDGGSDQFSLSQGGAGTQSFGIVKAGGTAFVEIRRSDTPGFQPSTVESHSMTVPVRYGLPGWKWASGTRSLTGSIENPVWIALNAYLKGKGVWKASAAVQEQYFDVAKVTASAELCETVLTKLLGTGTATQFRFTGIFQEQKPLRAWLQEILNNCLGNFHFDFGKLVISLRLNSSATEAFDTGNVIFQSVQLDPIEPAFNQLRINFADEEFGYKGNAVEIYNEPHAIIAGGAAGRPVYTKGTLNLAGVTSKDQAGRLASVRLCEELGGINSAQFAAARAVQFATTVLALNVTPATVCSLSMPDCPDYPAQLTTDVDKTPPTATFIEFRALGWRLNKDFSISIQGKTTNWDTYDVTVGPKPADVQADPVPGTPDGHPPANWGFRATTDRQGTFLLDQFNCASYFQTVIAGHFDIYYCPEDNQTEMFTPSGVDDNVVTTIDYGTYGSLPVVGEWIQIESEIMLVTTVTPTDAAHGTVVVVRGQAGTTAAAHPRVASTFTSHNADWACEYTVPAALAIQPGGGFVVGSDGSGEEAVVAEYDDVTGLLRTTLPLATATDGGAFLVVPVMRRIVRLQHTVNFPPRFFAAHANATFAEEISQPYAGIASIVGTLENTAGLLSNQVVIMPASEIMMTAGAPAAIPYAMRTGGGTRFNFAMSEVPGGDTNAAFNAAAAQHAQPFERAWFEISDPVPIALSPIGPPAPSAAPVLRIPGPGGSITITHTCSGWESITLSIAGLSSTWRADGDATITSSSTTAQIAASVAARFSDDAISRFYSFRAVSSVVQITDTSGRGGPMSVTLSVPNPYVHPRPPGVVPNGVLTISHVNIADVLGIVTGRRYAFAFYSAVPLLSGLSQPSASTGPTTAYGQILLSGLPASADSRVGSVRIYASDDPADTTAPSSWYLLATVANGTTDYLDTTTHATLIGGASYPGPIVNNAQRWLLTITKNGYPWVQFHIEPGHAKSNVVAGGALFFIAPGTLINANISNITGVPDGGTDVAVALLAVAE